jgi:hypothetical protein
MNNIQNQKREMTEREREREEEVSKGWGTKE